MVRDASGKGEELGCSTTPMHTSIPVLALPGSLASQSVLVARSPMYPKVTGLVLVEVSWWLLREGERKIGVQVCLLFGSASSGPHLARIGIFLTSLVMSHFFM